MIIPSGYESGLSKQEITNIKPIVIESRDVFIVISTILKIFLNAFTMFFYADTCYEGKKVMLKIN